MIPVAKMRIMFPAILFAAAYWCPDGACAQTVLDENHVQVAPGVVRVGTDIAYREDGTWKQAQAELVPAGNEAGSLKCETTRMKVYLAPTGKGEGWPFVLKYQDRLLRLRPTALVAYDPIRKSVRTLASAQAVMPKTYRMAADYTGVFPGVGLKVVVDREKSQLVYKITDRSFLKQAAKEETLVGFMMEMDLSSFAGGRVFIESEENGNNVRRYYTGSDVSALPPGEAGETVEHLETGETLKSHRIRFCLADASITQIFSSQEKPAVGSTGDPLLVYLEKDGNETANRTLPRWILKRIDGRDYLLQLISVSWLEKAELPVSSPTAFLAGIHGNPVEVFLPGNTYVVDGIYMVRSLTSLGTREQPVYVKFIPGRGGAVKTARRVKESKIEYTIFTSLYDNHPRRGAVVDPRIFGLRARRPRSGDYFCAFTGNLRTQGSIRDCQVYYARHGLAGMIAPAGETASIINVLLEHCAETGVYSEGGLQAINCTFRDCGRGTEIAGPEGNNRMINCVFAENRIGVGGRPEPSFFHCAWYADQANAETGNLGISPLTGQTGLVSDPFTGGAGGDCYLNADPSGGALLRDSGYGSTEELGLSGTGDSGPIDRGFYFPMP